jgi:hypothetical protein
MAKFKEIYSAADTPNAFILLKQANHALWCEQQRSLTVT